MCATLRICNAIAPTRNGQLASTATRAAHRVRKYKHPILLCLCWPCAVYECLQASQDSTPQATRPCTVPRLQSHGLGSAATAARWSLNRSAGSRCSGCGSAWTGIALSVLAQERTGFPWLIVLQQHHQETIDETVALENHNLDVLSQASRKAAGASTAERQSGRQADGLHHKAFGSHSSLRQGEALACHI